MGHTTLCGGLYYGVGCSRHCFIKCVKCCGACRAEQRASTVSIRRARLSCVSECRAGQSCVFHPCGRASVRLPVGPLLSSSSATVNRSLAQVADKCCSDRNLTALLNHSIIVRWTVNCSARCVVTWSAMGGEGCHCSSSSSSICSSTCSNSCSGGSSSSSMYEYVTPCILK